jgi:hypothetical protein
MTEQAIRYLRDLQRLSLRESDVLVVKVRSHITERSAKDLRDSIKSRLLRHDVIVLSGDIELGVITPAKAKAEEPKPEYRMLILGDER